MGELKMNRYKIFGR